MLMDKPANKPESVELLEPRIYSPLIVTPSPTASRMSIPSPEPRPPKRPSLGATEPRPSVLLPPPVRVVRMQKKRLRTVSLEKAKEMLSAPGALHLLPEELRAQSIVRPRSQEPTRPSAQLRMNSFDIISGKDPVLPNTPILVDIQGRQRIVSTTIALPTFCLDGPKSSHLRSPMAAPGATFRVGKGPERIMASLLPQPGEETRTKIKQALAHADTGEDRGRTMTRGPRSKVHNQYRPAERDENSSGDELQSDAQKLAADYHKLLRAQYRQSSTSRVSAESSNSDPGTHVRMVPQPLFAKPVPMAKGLNTGTRDSEASRMLAGASFESHEHRQSSGSRTSIPLRLSPSLRGGQRRRSSGRASSSFKETGFSFESAAAPEAESEPAWNLSPASDGGELAHVVKDSRASAYYPHIMPRKKPKTKARTGDPKKDSIKGQTATLSSFASDINVQRLGTPESIPDASALHSAPSPSQLYQREATASLHSQRLNRAMHKRLLKSAASKAAGRLRRKSSSAQSVRHPAGQNEKDTRYPVPDAASPHLLPSPSSARSPPHIRLGWSDFAKGAFAEARASMQRPERGHEPLVAHIQTHARPVDEAKGALVEPESPKNSKAMLSGGFSLMEGWRENKAEKRRRDLKKLITVVTPDGETRKNNNEGGGAQKPPVVSRRWSAHNWM